ncbi:hypothetical protein ACLK2H_06940 [Escherichia coli]
MIVSLIGTPSMRESAMAFWCLRTLTSIRSALNVCCCSYCMPVFCRASAPSCWGVLPGASPNDYDDGYDLATMYNYLRSRLSIPVISGLDLGHEPRTVTLPLGAQAQLSHNMGHSALTLTGHPVLAE